MKAKTFLLRNDIDITDAGYYISFVWLKKDWSSKRKKTNQTNKHNVINKTKTKQKGNHTTC